MCIIDQYQQILVVEVTVMKWMLLKYMAAKGEDR